MDHSRKNIWLIFGGMSPEHDISISSGRTAAEHIDGNRYAVTPVYIRRNGAWAIGAAPLEPGDDARGAFDALIAGTQGCDAGEAVSKARSEDVDAALLILHGACGEDGTIQGLLEMAGISYTGSGILASALAMDKVRCQRFLGGCGIPVAEFVFDEDASRHAEDLARQAEEKIGFPCVVKPSRAGSSVGVTIVRDAADLLQAILVAARIDKLVMVEKFVAGEELTCGVIESSVDGRIVRTALPVTAIRPKRSAFFDFVAKYTAGECDEITPAPIPADVTATIQTLSVQAFELLGCRDMARVDFIFSEAGPKLLEVNTIPGLTPTSLLPQQAHHAGIKFDHLLGSFLQNACARKHSFVRED